MLASRATPAFLTFVSAAGQVCTQLRIESDQYYLEDVPLRSILESPLVRTPVYIYSQQGFLDSAARYHEALAGTDSLLCYSVKSNSNLSVLSFLVQEPHMGLDVVSGGELQRALLVGCPPQKIVFAGVGKTDEEIRLGLENDILLFNCESVPEIERINIIAGEMGKTAAISARVNPDIEVDTHDYIKTGTAENKFGIPARELPDLWAKLKSDWKNIELKGMQAHIGSQLKDPGPYFRSLDFLLKHIESLRADGFPIKYVNLGGGFGIAYEPGESIFPLKEFGPDLVKKLHELELTLILEPGRSISGPNGILVTEIIYHKTSPAREFYIVDGAMNDLIRPALYNGWHEVLPMRQGAPVPLLPEEKNGKPADIVGPVCESGDFLAKDRQFPPMARGDHFMVLSTGAYGAVMSSRYNTRPLPQEVLVWGDRWQIVRDQEGFADMVAKERIADF